MQYGDGLVVVAISAFAALLCEFISWVLIYRTASYRALTQSIEKTSRRVESMKERQAGAAAAAAGRKSASRKIGRFEQSLKDSNQALSRAKFQSRPDPPLCPIPKSFSLFPLTPASSFFLPPPFPPLPSSHLHFAQSEQCGQAHSRRPLLFSALPPLPPI
ncbi:unnamed protein product [Closterium sp. Naga37s-1]|nr:unnamed protein product [Closterium sp. Naga37s-1]